MTGNDLHELQTRQDICRAEFVVALAWGLARDASAEALRYRAVAEGVSLHAAALAVLSTEPTEQGPPDLSRPPEQRAVPRHLYALQPVAADEATTTTSGAQRGRHRRR